MKPASSLMCFLCFPFFAIASEPNVIQGYAGQEKREIKALSAEEQDGLLVGKGMGLAKAAELNGYPGPLHVLELAKELRLTGEQLQRTETVFEEMNSQAKLFGMKLVDAERSLDKLFATKTITETNLQNMLEEIGKLTAQLREVHLAAHIKQAKILTADQVGMYSQLRGYTGNQVKSSHKHHHSH